jgi:truncated hemoglobin YjbI
MAYKHLRNQGYLERLNRIEQKVSRGRLAIEQVVKEVDMPDLAKKTKDQVKRFVGAVKTETDETKHAMAMLLQHLNGEKLTSEEWKWVRNQMGDVVKMLGLTGMAIAPGGSLLAILAKAIKADKYILPSAFKKQDEVTESLIMQHNHVVVKPSKIEGANKGLFSNQGFRKDQLIGLAHKNGQPVGHIGKMHNHSDEPNMYSIKKGNQRYVYAKRDIQPGEELTTNYRLQPELEQPEDFMRKGGYPNAK